MNKYTNIINNKYEGLTVIKYDGIKITKQGNKDVKWICKCNYCDNIKSYSVENIPKNKSCGCLRRQNKTKYKIDYNKTYGFLKPIREEKCAFGTQKKPKYKILCKCDCNKEILVDRNRLIKGRIKSCGCHQEYRKIGHIKHGYTSKNNPHPRKNLYSLYNRIKDRCYHENNDDYKDYGGRGIHMCKRWLWESGFQNFINDIMKDWQPGLSIDRIDVNKGYSPENCKLSNAKEQARNKRNTQRFELNGENLTLMEWCEKYNVKYSLVYKRLKMRKWNLLDALTRPKQGSLKLIAKSAPIDSADYCI